MEPKPFEETLTERVRNPPTSTLEAKLDELVDAMRSHTQAVYMWADACNALLNALLQSEEEDDTRYITDLKGNRIPVGPSDNADRTASA